MPSFKSNSNFPVPNYDSCQLDIEMKRNNFVINVFANPEKESILPWDKYEVGYFVSVDKLISKSSGCLPSGYVREE